MVRKRPQRTCIACRQTGDKRGLIRIVRTPEGEVAVDETGKRAGRGAYLCADPACWRAALGDRRIGRALKMTPSAEDLARLQEYLEALQAREDTMGSAQT
jgi:uncharacterized protein